MSLVQHRTHWVRRLAMLATALMLAVTCLSAYIRLSQAGLGCADWPRCYGARLKTPESARPAAPVDAAAVGVARAAHRLLAVAVLLILLMLMAVCFGSKPWLGRAGALALAALLLALGLAVLGRFSSGARVPAIAIGNLLGGVAMVAICWRIATRAAGRFIPPEPAAALRVWAWVAALILLAQLALGVLLSASYSGPSCEGLADCLSRSQAGHWPLEALNPWRVPELSATGAPANPQGATLHLLHRGLALLVVLPLGVLAWLALRGPSAGQGRFLLALLALQVVSGLALPALDLPLALALAHNLIGSLLFAATVRLA